MCHKYPIDISILSSPNRI